MPKTAYDLKLKGYVGGEDFDRTAVDTVLAFLEGKAVNVLIDSLGGSLSTGLSISAAFKQHGNVSVHFVGLNASAATIASLGAAHISIDAGAMYLVHKCSMAFFEWSSLNSDQFAELIADCEKIKADLCLKNKQPTKWTATRAASGTRTHDLFVTNEMLYRLSYCGLIMWSPFQAGCHICYFIANLLIIYGLFAIRESNFYVIKIDFTHGRIGNVRLYTGDI